MIRIHRFAFLFAIALLAIPAAAQKYRKVSVDRLGIGFVVSDRLEAVPVEFKAENPHLVVSFESKKATDYVQTKLGALPWYLTVLQFDPVSNYGPETGSPTTGEGEELSEEEKAEAEMRARYREILEKYTAHSFEEFVREKDHSDNDTRKFITAGKRNKGSSKRPPHVWWEYSTTFEYYRGSFLIWYRYAAVYTVDGKDVALICTIPVGLVKADKKYKVDSKYAKAAKKMLTSVIFLEKEDEDDYDKVRDKHAKTPVQKAELSKLKENIKDFDNWDYFTTPDYIVCFSWDRRDTGDRKPAYKFAIQVGDELEDIREQYSSYFPPYEGIPETYSVVRICSDYREYLNYGGPRGSAGYFSPKTKELCVFRDVNHMLVDFDEDQTLGVVFHEAWHQYADAYWPDVTLTRWFDEGLAEVFGSMRKQGRAWRMQYHEGRYEKLLPIIEMDGLIRSDKIIGWPVSKFYGGNAGAYYAQAWVMCDFLVRGEKKLGERNWNPAWSGILERYATACLEDKDVDKAAKAALRGVDVEEFDAAWQNWFTSGAIKKK